jgi:hypothetical protein
MIARIRWSGAWARGVWYSQPTDDHLGVRPERRHLLPGSTKHRRELISEFGDALSRLAAVPVRGGARSKEHPDPGATECGAT